MSTAPTVSVAMPVYNNARYLHEAVQSILKQTYTDFELIAVDDGSTDDSKRILDGYAASDPRVRVISRPNTGISGALNDALAAARGSLLARMDGDDTCPPNRLQLQVDALQQHSEVVLVGGRVLMVDPFGTPLYESNHQPTHEWIESQLLHGIGWAVVHGACMMRMEAVRAVGGYRRDRVPSEDLDLFLRLTLRGRAMNLPDILLHYRQHPRSTNHNRYADQERMKRMIATEAYAARGQSLPPDWKCARGEQMPIKKEINMWGWQAIKHHNLTAARSHARTLLKMAPFSMDSWRLAFCALRGR